MVSIICHVARQREGFWYLATMAFHAALFSIGLAGVELASFVITHLHFAAGLAAHQFNACLFQREQFEWKP
jgi:hypothetical protein